MVDEAYHNGYAAGAIDRRWGWWSEYAYYGNLDMPGSYSHTFSLGYRAGWRETSKL